MKKSTKRKDKNKKLENNRFTNLFFYFFAYSFIGFVVQSSYMKIMLLRGYLVEVQTFLRVLPLLPIFGFGAVGIILFFDKFKSLKKYPPLVYLVTTLICFVVEFGGGQLIKVFSPDGKNHLWDYSHSRFNLDGQVCLENTLLFGVGGLVIVYLVQPQLEKLTQKFNLNKVSIVLFIIFMLDFIYSVFHHAG
ncbi:MAG: putative ABC transporter permease [Pseudomonadales bacterium]|nr:putative ABC transporter permease [Pseudomonadales bacterium]